MPEPALDEIMGEADRPLMAEAVPTAPEEPAAVATSGTAEAAVKQEEGSKTADPLFDNCPWSSNFATPPGAG
eukprot:2124234-Alexandrium_andersonii.AAC.1